MKTSKELTGKRGYRNPISSFAES